MRAENLAVGPAEILEVRQVFFDVDDIPSQPDEERGMIVKAYIVLHPGHTAGPELIAALQGHAKKEIAPYKYPRAIEFVAALPRTQTGKLQRFELRRIAASHAEPASAPAAE